MLCLGGLSTQGGKFVLCFGWAYGEGIMLCFG